MVVALLSAVPCFGKRVNLNGDWERLKKSISIDLPMDAFIEETSKELIVNFHEDIGMVYVTVTSSTGEIIYSERIQSEIETTLIIPLEHKFVGLLQITDGVNKVYGTLSF